MIKNELIKITKSSFFVILLAFVFIFFLFGFSMSFNNNFGLDYSLVQSLYNSSILNSKNGIGNLFLTGFNVLIPIICMFSYSISINSEKNGYYRYVQLRTSRKKYLMSKMIASFIATFIILGLCTILNVIVLSIVFRSNPNNELYLVMTFLNNAPTNLQIMVIQHYLLFSFLYFIVSTFFISLLSCFSVLFIYYFPFIMSFAIYIGVPLGIQILVSLNKSSPLNKLFFDYNIFSLNNLSATFFKYIIIVFTYFIVFMLIILIKKKKNENLL